MYLIYPWATHCCDKPGCLIFWVIADAEQRERRGIILAEREGENSKTLEMTASEGTGKFQKVYISRVGCVPGSGSFGVVERMTNNLMIHCH